MIKRSDNRISPGAILCAVYLCLLGTALPLAVHNAYFDTTRTKAIVFLTLSGLFVLAWLTAALLRRADAFRMPRLDWPDALFALFAATQIASTLLFRISTNLLLAPDNRYQGVLSFASYLAVFLILRREGRFTPLVRFALLLGASIAAFLGILDLFGASILPLRALTPAAELPRFLSTVGNISFFGALCVLFLPLSAYYAISADTPRRGLPYALCALLFLFGGLAARTEGFLLGALVFFAVIPLFCRDERVLRRIPLLWGGAAVAAGLFRPAMELWALYRPSVLARLLLAPAPALALCLLSAALFFLLRGKDGVYLRKARKVYIIFFFSLAAAALLFLLLANTLWRERLPAPLSSIVVFSPSWGTDRGEVWASFWQMFLSSPPLKKLIGSGAGSLAAWDSSRRLFSDALTDSAHNEYLHYLLTGGLLGLLSYLALLVLALRKAFAAPSRGRTAVALGCLAYAAQAAVNIAQPFTTPLFFALLALQLSDRGFEEGADDLAPFPAVALCALAFVLLVAASA